MWVHCSCTDGCEPSCGCWELNLKTSARSGQSCLLSPCLLWPKDLFIIKHKYTVAIFWHIRRGHQIPLQMVVSHHVVAGIWTQDLSEEQSVLLPAELSHQPHIPFLCFKVCLFVCLFIYLFILCEYTVAVQMVVSLHVIVGNWIFF